MTVGAPQRAPRPNIAALISAQGLMRASEAGLLVTLAIAFTEADEQGWLSVGVALQLGAMVVGLPVAGAVVDRLGGARMLGVNHLVRTAMLVLAVGAWMSIGPTTSGLIIVTMMAVAVGLADALAEPAFHSLVPRLVSPDQLASVNGASAMQARASIVGGAALAGVGTSTADTLGGLIAVVGLSVAGLLLAPGWTRLAVRRHVWQAAQDPSNHVAVKVMVREGLAYAAGRRWLCVLLALFSVWGLIVAAQRVAIPLLAEPLGSGGYALYTTIYALGSAIGALGAIRWDRWSATGALTIALTMAVAAAFYAAVGMLGPATGLIAMALSGVGIGVAVVQWAVLMQRRVAPEMLGRISSLDWLATLAPGPVAALAIGQLLRIMSPAATVIVVGATATVLSLTAVVALTRPWRARRTIDAPA